MNLNNLELLLMQYIQNHPNTARKVVVDVLGYSERPQQRRVRQALDSLTLRGYLVASAKPVRYTVKVKPNANA